MLMLFGFIGSLMLLLLLLLFERLMLLLLEWLLMLLFEWLMMLLLEKSRESLWLWLVEWSMVVGTNVVTVGSMANKRDK